MVCRRVCIVGIPFSCRSHWHSATCARLDRGDVGARPPFPVCFGLLRCALWTLLLGLLESQTDVGVGGTGVTRLTPLIFFYFLNVNGDIDAVSVVY